MIIQFLYKGPVTLMGFYYSGPPWLFLLAILVLALALVGIIIVTGPSDIARIMRDKLRRWSQIEEK